MHTFDYIEVEAREVVVPTRPTETWWRPKP